MAAALPASAESTQASPPSSACSSPSDLPLPATSSGESSMKMLTWYRALVTSSLVSLGTWKVVAEYQGQAIISNSLDVVLGLFLSVVCFWLGEFEKLGILRWLFRRDPTTDCQVACKFVTHHLRRMASLQGRRRPRGARHGAIDGGGSEQAPGAMQPPDAQTDQPSAISTAVAGVKDTARSMISRLRI